MIPISDPKKGNEMAIKVVRLNFENVDVINHWWTDFALSCKNSKDFEEKLDKYNIVIYSNDRKGNFVLHFKSKEDYLLFRLRFP